MTTATPNIEKLDFKKILPVFVIIFIDMLGLSIIIPLLPLYATRYGANAFLVGLLSATYPLMQFIGAPLLGRLSDRMGRKPILLLSQFGTLVGFLVLGFANALWVLFLSRIIDGLSGANISTAQAVITDKTSEKTRTQGLGLIGAAFGLGFIAGPIIAFPILALSGDKYQYVAFAAALFSFLSMLLTYFWLDETLPPEKRGQNTFKRRYTFGAMREALGLPAIGFLMILMFAQQLAFGGYEQLFSFFLINRLGMNALSIVGLLVLAGLVIAFIQGFLLGRLSRAFGDRKLVFIGLMALGIGLILNATTPHIPVPWYDKTAVSTELSGKNSLTAGQNLPVVLPDEVNKGWFGIIWLLVASVPTALGGGVLQPAINSLITKATDPAEVGGILGVSAGFNSVANAAAPVFFGTLFQLFNSTVPFFVGGLLLLALWWVARNVIRSPQPIGQ